MYEKFFKNKKGYNTAKITVSGKVKSFDLYYHLSDNPVQHIWQDIHIEGNKIINGTTAGLKFDKVVEEINYLCKIENVGQIKNNFTQSTLNNLHRKYVKSNHNSNWLRINDLIHILESKLDNPFSKYDYSVNFYSTNKKQVPIKEEYKMFLASDAVWGRLVLGYATLGKDWVTIPANDDNIEHLELQKNITSEAYLSFSVQDPYPCYREINTYNWAKKQKFDVPIDNLNQLNLGRYFLGQIIITDNLLEIHDDFRNWYVPNHSCKLNFNKEVLGSEFKINKIEFFDSNIAYEQFLKHSDFPCIQ